MAGTTTNGFPYPESTDFVTDGAQAIEDLAVDVDKQLGLWKIDDLTASFTGGTAGTVSNGTITIGSANTKITVSNAFNSKFDNYRIVYSVNSISAANATIRMELGASIASYNSARFIVPFDSTSNSVGATAEASGLIGVAIAAEGADGSFDIFRPNLAKYTTWFCSNIYRATGTAAQLNMIAGLHQVSTAYTGFSFFMSTGSFTGGKIRIYGYNN